MRDPLGNLHSGYLLPRLEIIEVNLLLAVILLRGLGVGPVYWGPLAIPQNPLKQLAVKKPIGQIAGRLGGPAVAAAALTIGNIMGAEAGPHGIGHLGGSGQGNVGGQGYGPLLRQHPQLLQGA